MFNASDAFNKTLAFAGGNSGEGARLEQRFATAATWLFTISVLVVSALTSGRKPFWIDEIYTICVAAQPTVADLLASLREGCDQQAPLYALLARAGLSLVGNQHLAIRLPATLGVCLMCPCIYYFLRRYTRPLYAFVAVLLTYHLVGAYAVEGRCYGLVLGLVALALLCFRVRHENGRGTQLALFGFFFAVTVATALQYFAVILVLIAFSCELLEWYVKRTADKWMLLACVASLLVLLPHLPFMEASQPFMPHYWARIDSLEPIRSFYGRLLPRLWGCLVAGLSAYVVGLIASGMLKVSLQTRGQGQKVPLSVLCFLVASALVPPIFGIVALFSIKVFVSRYVMWSLIALCILLALAIARATSGSALVALAMAISLLYDYSVTSRVALQDPPHLYESENLRLALQYAPPFPREILIADHHAYMENWFYAAPDVKDRLVHPISIALETLYTNKDTDPRLLSALRRRITINTPDYESFLRSRSRFLVAADMYRNEWIVNHLTRSGYTFTPIFRGFNSVLYDVRRPS